MSVDMPVDVPPLDVELRAVGAADCVSGMAVGWDGCFDSGMAGKVSSSRSK